MPESDSPDLSPYLKTLSEGFDFLSESVRKILEAQLQTLSALDKLCDSLKDSQVKLLQEVLVSNATVLKALDEFSRRLALPPSNPLSSPSGPKSGGGKIQ